MSASKAAEDIKLLAKRFQPLFAAAEALEKIGSIENAAKEADIRKEKAYKEAEEAKAYLSAYEKKIESVKADYEKAQQFGEVLKKEAEDKASMIILKAKADAEVIMKDVNYKHSEADRLHKDAEKAIRKVLLEIEEKKKEKAELEEQVNSIKNKLAAFIR